MLRGRSYQFRASPRSTWYGRLGLRRHDTQLIQLVSASHQRLGGINTCSTRVYLANLAFVLFLFRKVLEDAFSHWAAADVAQTYKKYGDWL